MIRSRARNVFSFLAVAFVAASAAGYGCGSSSSNGGNGDGVALCNQFCSKFNELCAVDAGGFTFTMNCATECTPAMVSQHTTTCPNSSAIISGTQACLNKTTCDDLTACFAGLPQCGGSNGTGSAGHGGTTGGAGTSGGAGTTGSAGTTGGAGTTGAGGRAGATGTGGFGFGGFGGNLDTSGTCADLLACCNRATGNAQSACMNAYTTIMSSGDQTCGIELAVLKSFTCP